jgi:hypothetical protein
MAAAIRTAATMMDVGVPMFGSIWGTDGIPVILERGVVQCKVAGLWGTGVRWGLIGLQAKALHSSIA